MKKLTLVAFIVALFAPAAFAQEDPGQLGLGFNMGVPFGFSAKYLIDDQLAIDGALGAQDNDIDTHMDFLVHIRDLWSSLDKGKIPAHLGFGLKIKDEDETLYGIRFVGGLDYIVRRHPIEIFAEIAPIMRLAPSVGSDFEGAIGLRFYFSTRRRY